MTLLAVLCLWAPVLMELFWWQSIEVNQSELKHRRPWVLGTNLWLHSKDTQKPLFSLFICFTHFLSFFLFPFLHGYYWLHFFCVVLCPEKERKVDSVCLSCSLLSYQAALKFPRKEWVLFGQLLHQGWSTVEREQCDMVKKTCGKSSKIHRMGEGTLPENGKCQPNDQLKSHESIWETDKNTGPSSQQYAHTYKHQIVFANTTWGCSWNS